LCGVLQILIHQLGSQIFPHSDKIMALLLHLLKSPIDVMVHDECLLTISAMADCLKGMLLKYIPEVMPCVLAALSNWEDSQICFVAVELVGDLTRAIESKIAPYCDKLMNALFLNLMNADLDKSVKPATLSTIGDIALALVAEPCDIKFSRYFSVAIKMLEQASFTVVHPDLKEEDHELWDYVQTLKVGVLEAYIGICQSLIDSGESQLMVEHLQSVVDLILSIAQDKSCDDDTIRLAVGLCGDVINLFDGDISKILPRIIYDWVNWLTKHGKSDDTRDTATYTANLLFLLKKMDVSFA